MRRHAGTLDLDVQSASTSDDLRTDWALEEERAGSPFLGILLGVAFALPFWILLVATIMWLGQ